MSAYQDATVASHMPSDKNETHFNFFSLHNTEIPLYTTYAPDGASLPLLPGGLQLPLPPVELGQDDEVEDVGDADEGGDEEHAQQGERSREDVAVHAPVRDMSKYVRTNCIRSIGKGGGGLGGRKY